MAHLPILLVCLRALGQLADKFAHLTNNVIEYLRDFLVDPSPILLTLYYQSQQDSMTQAQQITVNNINPTQDLATSSLVAYEKLRETAIDNLCSALKAGIKVIDQKLS